MALCRRQLLTPALRIRPGGQSGRGAVADVLAQFGKPVRADIHLAAAIPHADTADILISVSRVTDKQLWLVEAQLNPAQAWRKRLCTPTIRRARPSATLDSWVTQLAKVGRGAQALRPL